MQYRDSFDNLVYMAEDEMSASIYLRRKPDEELYTVEELKALLKGAGVTSGVHEDQLRKIVMNGLYDQILDVAEGKPQVNGQDGKFELLFRTKLPSSPVILKDGSVDYMNIDLFEKVEKDQLVAVYHKATTGSMGYTVKGKILMQKKGKDKPAMRGKGFHISEDNLQYFSDMEGKIEFVNGQIIVTNTFSVTGDLDSRYGNIIFTGDVSINGAVRSGMKIEAGGNISISGIVESAEIRAGGDVLLRSGVLGNHQCKIWAKHDIYGKFMENAEIFAEGIVSCNYILNSYVVGLKGVEVHGKRGIILGGVTEALGYIKAGSIGNEMETYTKVQVGVSGEYVKQLESLREAMDKVNAEIALLEQNLHVKSEQHEKIVTILCTKINERLKLSKRIEELEILLKEAKNAFIEVEHDAFPRVNIRIDIARWQLTSAWHHVTFRREKSHIVTYQNV